MIAPRRIVARLAGKIAIMPVERIGSHTAHTPRRPTFVARTCRITALAVSRFGALAPGPGGLRQPAATSNAPSSRLSAWFAENRRLLPALVSASSRAASDTL